MNKSNKGKSNPVTLDKMEDNVLSSINKIMIDTGLVKICNSYNPKDDTFSFDDSVYKGIVASMYRVITGFAQRNIEASEATTKTVRYGSKTAKANPLTKVAIEQRDILEKEGFFDLCDVLEDAQKALYPRKSA